MNDVALRIEEELRSIPAVRQVLSSVGSGFLGSVNSANFYIQLVAHEERTFGWKRLLQWPPWRAIQGNYSQRDIQQEIRQRLKTIPRHPRCHPQPPNIRLGAAAATSTSTSPCSVPTWRRSPPTPSALREKAPELGLLDADTTLRLDKPELRVQIDRDRAANLGVDTQDIANALRIMVGGDTRVTRFRDESMNEDYDVQIRLGGRRSQ